MEWFPTRSHTTTVSPFRPDLGRKVSACHVEPERCAGNLGLPSTVEGFPDDGRDQGGADDQAGPGVQAAGMADVGTATARTLPLLSASSTAKVSGALRHSWLYDGLVGVPGPDDVLGQQRGEAGADFSGLCGLVEAQEIAPLGRQLQVTAWVGFQGLAVAQAAPVLGESSPHTQAGRSGSKADGVDDPPGCECQ
jgi:hypothetical protein